jgi:hypothetical protein
LLTTLATHEPALPPDVAAGAPPAADALSAEVVENEAHGERATGAARAEVAFFQTVHGIALGAELCLITECNDAQPWTLALMAGGGAGFGVSWYLTRDGVRPGLARALTDGVLFGAANGLGLMAATGALDDTYDEDRVIGAHLALGQLGGLGLAAGFYHALQPTAGQVSLTASGGIWALAVFGQAAAIFEPSWDGQTWASVLLVAGDAGLVAGGFFAAEEPMSASRVMLIDAGGLLGALTGLGVGVLAQGETIELAPTFGASLGGTLLGLGLDYHLTSGWESGETGQAPARFALVPTRGGGLATWRGTW